MTMERDALLREVQDELRRDQLQKLWDQYGTYFIGGAVAILALIGGYKWWEARRAAAAELAGSQFEQALEFIGAGNEVEARKVLNTIGAARSSYGALAQLSLAGQAVKAGNTDAAVAAYEAAAAKADDTLIKDFARLQSVSLKIDTADFTEVQNRLNDLVGDKSPWRYMAREIVGVSAIRAGRLDDARNLLAPLAADPRASAAVRERAGALMSIVVAAELAKSAPAKVELEKTEASDAPASAGDVSPSKADTPRPKAASPKGGAAKGK